MYTEKNLSDLRTGQTAAVLELSGEPDMRRRLQDMGLIPGTRVECLNISPLGDPAAYFIRGAVIALRSKDAAKVAIEALSPLPERAVLSRPGVLAG